ncbi:MAG: PepSY domain-containing protein [bacterium]|nr:PepSY domain-containing protein [bacterium]
MAFKRKSIQLLARLHRYAGLVGSVFFAVWFVSGVFMMYVEMPYFRQSRFAFAGDATLNASAVRLTPAAAVARSGLSQDTPDRMRLVMLQDRPVYRLHYTDESSGSETIRTVFADTGELLTPLQADEAMRIARDFAKRMQAFTNENIFPDQADFGDLLIDLVPVDQWTLYGPEFRGQRPLFRIAAGDEAGTEIYVSQKTGAVVQMTRRDDRLLAWAGPVIHWMYFANLRRHAALWSTTVLWVSGAGVFVACSGFVLGFLRLRNRKGVTGSPFSETWMRWHHWLGLLFGLVTCTWIFSGWMSMTPMNWAPGISATRTESAALRGGPLRLDNFSKLSPIAAQNAHGDTDIREIEFVQLRGQAHLRITGITSINHQESAGAARAILWPALTEGDLCAAASDLRPRDSRPQCEILTEWDAYYYAKPGSRFQFGRRVLPVLRVDFEDASRHSYYIDPAGARIVARYESRSRWNRWLYQGLHSFSIPVLYQNRPLWDLIMLLFLAGGLALALTAIVLTLRKFK